MSQEAIGYTGVGLGLLFNPKFRDAYCADVIGSVLDIIAVPDKGAIKKALAEHKALLAHYKQKQVKALCNHEEALVVWKSEFNEKTQVLLEFSDKVESVGLIALKSEETSITYQDWMATSKLEINKEDCIAYFRNKCVSLHKFLLNKAQVDERVKLTVKRTVREEEWQRLNSQYFAARSEYVTNLQSIQNSQTVRIGN